MTKGCKIWLYILFIMQIIGCVSTLATAKYIMALLDIGLGYIIVGTILSLAAIISCGLLLFQQKKVGFYGFCAIALISFIRNIIIGFNFFFALFCMVVAPLITYLFMKSNGDVFT